MMVERRNLFLIQFLDGGSPLPILGPLRPAIPWVRPSRRIQRRTFLPLPRHLLRKLVAPFSRHGDELGAVLVVRVHAVGQRDVVGAKALGDGGGLRGWQ